MALSTHSHAKASLGQDSNPDTLNRSSIPSRLDYASFLYYSHEILKVDADYPDYCTFERLYNQKGKV